MPLQVLAVRLTHLTCVPALTCTRAPCCPRSSVNLGLACAAVTVPAGLLQHAAQIGASLQSVGFMVRLLMCSTLLASYTISPICFQARGGGKT